MPLDATRLAQLIEGQFASLELRLRLEASPGAEPGRRRIVAVDADGIEREQVITAVARHLGFRRSGR